MTATLVYVSAPMLAANLWALGICVGLAVLILIGHLARPAVKRVLAGLAFACALFATVETVTVRADDGDFVILNPCRDLSPSDPLWWLYGCMWP